MSSDIEKDLYKLIGKYEAFSQQVLNDLSDVKKSLTAGDLRMSHIEKNLAERGVCLVHQDIIARLDKKDIKDDVRDTEIGDVKSDVRVVEYRLSTSDMAKVSLIAAGVAAPLIELVKWLITRTL